MFPNGYFGRSYFGDSYFGPTGEEPEVVVVHVPTIFRGFVQSSERNNVSTAQRSNVQDKFRRR